MKKCTFLITYSVLCGQKWRSESNSFAFCFQLRIWVSQHLLSPVSVFSLHCCYFSLSLSPSPSFSLSVSLHSLYFLLFLFFFSVTHSFVSLSFPPTTPISFRSSLDMPLHGGPMGDFTAAGAVGANPYGAPGPSATGLPGGPPANVVPQSEKTTTQVSLPDKVSSMVWTDLRLLVVSDWLASFDFWMITEHSLQKSVYQ